MVPRACSDDGYTYYGQLNAPWAAFYDFRTEDPVADLSRTG